VCIEGLLETGNALFACGWEGFIGCIEPGSTRTLDSPTKAILSGLATSANGDLYSCGRVGTLCRIDTNDKSVTKLDEIGDDLWSATHFHGETFVSSMRSIYRLDGGALKAVDDGCDGADHYHLSSNDGIMLSVGTHTVSLFDGQEWLRLA
jgi:hypothetical protein